MSTTVQSPARLLTGVRQPSFRREQLWLPVAIVLAALIAIAGWMLLVSPVRDETAALTAQTDTAATQTTSLRHRVATLQAQEADLPRFTAELAAAKAALPVDTGMPTLLRTLQDLGTTTHTSVTTLTADAPTVTGVNGAESNGAAGGVPAPGTVYRMPVTITAKGSAADLTVFLAKLQATAPRALLVSDVHLADADSGQQLDVTAVAFLQPTASVTGGR